MRGGWASSAIVLLQHLEGVVDVGEVGLALVDEGLLLVGVLLVLAHRAGQLVELGDEFLAPLLEVGTRRALAGLDVLDLLGGGGLGLGLLGCGHLVSSGSRCLPTYSGGRGSKWKGWRSSGPRHSQRPLYTWWSVNARVEMSPAAQSLPIGVRLPAVISCLRRARRTRAARCVR